MDRSIRNRHAALVATLAFVVAACATAAPDVGAEAAVPTYRGNAARTGEMAGPGPGANPAIKWQFDADGPFGNSPVVGGGVVYAASGEGAVHALDLATGSQRWSVDVGSRVSASPVLVGRLVILADEDGAVHAISAADGSQAWTAETDGPITGSPAAVGDDIVVATTGTHAYRLDAPTGNQVWSVDIGGATTRSVTVDDDTAYLGLEGDIVAIALSDGRERWRATIAASGNVGTPTIVGDLVYAATGIDGEPADAGVAAIDATSGEVRWRYTSPTHATVYTPAVMTPSAGVDLDRQAVAAPVVAGAPGAASSSTGSGIVTIWRTDDSATGRNASRPPIAPTQIVAWSPMTSPSAPPMIAPERDRAPHDEPHRRVHPALHPRRA